jgi:hypothetical protein
MNKTLAYILNVLEVLFDLNLTVFSKIFLRKSSKIYVFDGKFGEIKNILQAKDKMLSISWTKMIWICQASVDTLRRQRRLPAIKCFFLLQRRENE